MQISISLVPMHASEGHENLVGGISPTRFAHRKLWLWHPSWFPDSQTEFQPFHYRKLL